MSTVETASVCTVCRCGHDEHAHDPDGCNGVPHAETCKCLTFVAEQPHCAYLSDCTCRWCRGSRPEAS